MNRNSQNFGPPTLPDTCAKQFPLVSMGGWSEGLACADQGERTRPPQSKSVPGLALYCSNEPAEWLFSRCALQIICRMLWIVEVWRGPPSALAEIFPSKQCQLTWILFIFSWCLETSMKSITLYKVWKCRMSSTLPVCSGSCHCPTQLQDGMSSWDHIQSRRFASPRSTLQ
jgi:hypothetical protein